MSTTQLNTSARALPSQNLDRHAALKFITCGSVDDGKSTLIGRLLIDSRSVLQDQLENVSKSGAADLALFTDGLSAEREQGITIDVAYRYFATPARKFIIGDAPGHEQYTRNMVTAASSADAAVVLVDATKLKWKNLGKDVGEVTLLPQTRRHALLLKLLRVPSIVFAVNKLDALEDPAHPQQATVAFTCIREALETFAAAAGIAVAATIPMSALQGHNVVTATAGWCGYHGASLLRLLETLPVTPAEAALPLSFPVQWVEKFSSSSDTSQGRRVFWGRVATGAARVGQRITVFPSGKTATIAQVLNHVRQPEGVAASHSAGIVLDRELDVSRGDWLLAEDAALAQSPTVSGTVAWMDDAPLVVGRAYWVLHGHRWIKAKVQRITHRLDVNTLETSPATELEPNAIGHITLSLQQPIAALGFGQSRVLGSLILVDTATHATAGALLIE
jgi:sulfate adenylyltransferase subunit 1